VTLSGGGAEVATVRTPLKVSHAAGCTTAPQLTVQLNTTLAGAVDVVGRLTVGGVDLLASLQTLQALLTNLGTSSLALGLVGWTAGDAPGMATVVADYEAFRLNGGTEGYVCITTSHDSNNFVRKLEMNDGGTVTISTSTSRGCADAMRWQIFTPATTSDGRDWTTATGDGRRVVVYNPHRGKYMGLVDLNGGGIESTTTYGELQSWSIVPI
jgi:hypothetical protein